MSRILVTGGAGAIGSNLVVSLLEQEHEVVVLDDLSSGQRHLVPHDAVFVEGSVTNNADLALCFEPPPDYVVHMAALFANQNSVDHPERDLEVSGIGTLKVLQYSTESRVKKVLSCSSSCVYGNQEVVCEEDQDVRPDTPYGITKLLGERYCRFWAKHYGIDVVIVRPFNSYGPHEYPGKYRNVIPNFFKLAMEGKPLPITGTGKEARDFTFVKDTVQGLLGALFGYTKPGQVFNIASGTETEIITIANKINEITNNKSGICFLPRRNWDTVTRRRGEISKARAAFSYAPSSCLDDGLAATYSWLKSVDA